MKITSSIIILLFFIVCCTKKNESKQIQNVEELNIHSKKSITLKLDSETGFYNRYIRYQAIEGEEYFALLNSLNSKIQVYDPTSGEMVWSLKLQTEGPNSVGQRPQGFVIEDFNTVYVFDAVRGRISKVNAEGKVLEKYETVRNGPNSGAAYPIVENSSPLTKIKDEFIIGGIVPGGWRSIEVDPRTMLKVSTTNQLSYWLERPEIYEKLNWGNDLMYYTYYDYDSINHQFFISPFAYDKLIIADTSGIIKEVPTPSIFFDEPIPLNQDYKYEPDMAELRRYYFNTPYFSGIYHNMHTNITYRLTSYPLEPHEIEAGKEDVKRSIMLFDGELKKIGEAKIDKEVYDPRMIFMHKDGLYMASVKKFMENEDELVFDLIEFVND